MFGNAAVIIYNICLNHERTLSSWLVTNLALADLLVCLTIYPKAIVRYFLSTEKYDDVFQKLGHSVLHVSLFLSATMLLSITVDKYVFIAKASGIPSHRNIAKSHCGSLCYFVNCRCTAFNHVYLQQRKEFSESISTVNDRDAVNSYCYHSGSLLQNLKNRSTAKKMDGFRKRAAS